MKTLVNSVLMAFLLFAAGAAAEITVQHHNSQTTVISIVQDDLILQEKDQHMRLLVPSAGRTSDLALPDLPVYTRYIPMDGDGELNVTYNIVQSHTISDIQVYPVTPFDLDDEMDFSRYESFYATSQQYPESHVVVSEPIVMRDQRFVRVDVTPFSVNAADERLTIHDEVEVVIQASDAQFDHRSTTRKRSRAFEPLYRELMPDYEPSSRDEDYQQPAILFLCSGNSFNNPYYNQLVEWKRKKGFIVYTGIVNLIGTSSSDIKDYIEDAYQTFDPPPEFVTLIGDVDGSYAIPTYFETWAECSGSPCYGEGDYPYALLEGDDLYPEVILGRISVRNSQELGIVVRKSINYEQTVGEDWDWYESASLLANTESYGTGQSILNTNEYLEMMFDLNGFEDIRAAVRYDGISASNWMHDQLNLGTSFMNFRGLYGPASFDIGVILNNISSHMMLPFVTFITCGTGSFAYETSAPCEQFIRYGISPSNYSGAVAAVSTATWGTHTQFNNLVSMGMYDGIFNQGAAQAGTALVAGKMALVRTYPQNPSNYVDIFCHWNNLMGDPSLQLWTDVPAAVDVEHENSIMIDTDIFIVTVRDSEDAPISNALVSLLKDDEEIPLIAYSDEQGVTSFHLNYESDGAVYVTVTGKNLIPSQTLFAVEETDYSMRLDQVNQDDSAGGNDDGLINPGEVVDMQIQVTNDGEWFLGDLAASLTCLSNTVSVTSESVVWGILDPGDTATLPFELSISPSASDGDDGECYMTLLNGTEERWDMAVPVMVFAARPVFHSLTLTEGSGFTAGELVSFAVTLLNEGSQVLEDVTGELVYTGVQPLMVENGTSSWTLINPGNTSLSHDVFTLQLGDDLIGGQPLPMELVLSAGESLQQTISFQIDAGELTQEDPTIPDKFGHYIYGSNDVGYPLAPVYGWHEIDPEKGGEGTLLPLFDCGFGVPEGQEPAIVELPFPVVFYGESYTTISVSTNGWIAYGESSSAAFRNTPVPGPAGPSPMLAVFWDDLRNYPQGCYGQPIGGVYYFEDPAGEYVIIEWSDLETFYASDRENFQAILFAQEEGSDADTDIKLQYKVFNNTTSGLYLPDYHGLIHGGYATIGLESAGGVNGLQYSFDDNYMPAAAELADESALFITESLPVNLFTADQNVGGPPLTVQFTANPEYQDVNWSWDFDGDGIVDSTEPDPQWTYAEYGHFSVELQISDGENEWKDRRKHFIHLITFGCTDPLASNFDPTAEMDDGTCNYISGCMDSTALNYNDEAVLDDGSCFYVEFTSFNVDDVQDNAGFGQSLDVNEGFAIVGASKEDVSNRMDQGAAFIFHQNDEMEWEEDVKILAEDGDALDYFGNDVALDGEYAVIGAYKSDTEYGINAGAAYVFKRAHSGDWFQQFKLLAEDASSNDNFGYSVDMLGNYAIVGAYRHDDVASNAGAAYLYFRNPDDTWDLVQKLTASDGSVGDAFGSVVALSEDFLVVGAELRDGTAGNSSGGAYVYQRHEDGSCTEHSILTAEDGAAYDHFGCSVSIDGSTIFVGAYLDNNENGTIAGSAHIYEYDGENWTHVRRLVGNIQDDHYFGEFVTVQGDFAAVSSNFRMYLYALDENGEWSDGSGFDSVTNESVSLDGMYVLAGDSGESYVNSFSLVEWEEWLSVDDPDFILPSDIRLYRNYPNPFNPVTSIPYAIPTAGHVSIHVYDLLGQEVAELVDSWQSPGGYITSWNADHLSSGIYFVRLQFGDDTQSMKMMMVK